MKLGSCFESSYLAFMNLKEHFPGIYKLMKDVKLVHGLVTGTGGEVKNKKYAHGWVEFSLNNGAELCFDSETGFAIAKDTFYMVGRVTEAETYTMKEVLYYVIKYEHYGPWTSNLVEKEKEHNPSFLEAKKGVHYE